MTEQLAPLPVNEDECLARFILFNKWLRIDHTIRPDAFIPHSWPELFVTRHLGLSEAELWQIGQSVADKRTLPLYGRADVEARAIRKHSLCIQPTPEPKNHANITGWPKEKPAQKIIAQEIAAAAKFISTP
ncbi:MAG: hypothetical protein V1854_07615 [Methanobacteriota archaeon]